MRRPAIRLPYLFCALFSLLLVQVADAQDSTSLAQGQVGTTYSTSITTEGGLKPFAWRLTAGELPPGLSLSESEGKIEGKPTTAKSDAYAFTLSVSDSSQPPQIATMRFSVVIQAAPLHITGALQTPVALKIVGAKVEGKPATDAPAVAKTDELPAAKQNNATQGASAGSSANPGAPSGASAAAVNGNGQAAVQSAQTGCGSGQPPFLIGTLAAGERTLDGCAESSGVAAVRVGVIPAGSVLTCADSSKYSQVAARLLPAESGATAVEFLAQLQNPLIGGQQVCLVEMSAGGGVVETSALLPVASVLATSSNPCATVKDLPAITGSLVNGQTSVPGCAESSALAVQISVIDVGANVQCSDTAGTFVQQPPPFLIIPNATDSFSQFSAQLPSPLKTGQQVCLAEIAANNTPGKATASAAIVKSAPVLTADTCESTLVAYFPEPPVTGRKVLSGCAGQAPGIRLIVYPKDKVNECPALDLSKAAPSGSIDDQPGNVDLKTGIFNVELGSPVADDELLCPYALTKDHKPPVVVTKWGYAEADSPLGRTRYYVSTGVELSENNQQFSNQDLYLGLALDRNWLRGKPDRSFTALFNSEFSAQLISIPVAASSTSTTTSSTTTTPSVGTFISSQKAAVVGGSLYAPLYANAFKGWFGGGTTGFVAPIVKGGLQTITSGALSATAPVPGTTTTTATVNNTGLYYFWGAGLRLGDLRLHSSWNIAPEVLSHLDLTFGQWENFKQCRNASNCTPGSNGIVPSNQLYQPFLLALEGQLNIPKTPIMIGFRSVTPISGGGQGDLRFFFGVKLDVGCIYKSFKGGSTPSFLQCTDDQPATNSSPTSSSASASAAKSGGGGASATSSGAKQSQ